MTTFSLVCARLQIHGYNNREPRSVKVEFVDFDDEKIRQTRKDNY